MPKSRTHTISHTTTVKGAGLARGPALVVGLVLAVFGLVLFFRVTGAPLSTTGFPDATATGERFLGFEANAWTAWLTIAAGVLLLFGAAQHLIAKTMSLVVGLALGAAAVIALVDGDDVLGLAAANGLTALGWGIAAALLLANTLLPRLRHDRQDGDDHAVGDERRVTREPTEVRSDSHATRDRVPAFADLRSPDRTAATPAADDDDRPGRPDGERAAHPGT